MILFWKKWIFSAIFSDVFLGYLILYNVNPQQADKHWVVEGVVGAQMSKSIKGLTPDTVYYFKIHAHNKKGYGPFSDVISYTTPAGK